MANTIIPLKELRQDALLPVAIYDAQNITLMLLNRGITLTRENLQTLQRRGISHVAIDSRYVKDVWVAPGSGRTGVLLQQHFLAEQRKKRELQNQSLTARLVKPAKPHYDHKMADDFASKHQEQERSLQDFLGSMETSKHLRGEVVQSVATESIEDLLSDVDLFVKLTLEGGHQEHLHQHCLRVAKLAMSMATILGFREDDVRQLGIGCLLSRVGMDEAMKGLVSSRRSLTPLEFLEIKKHPGRTWNALERITDLPVGARQVAWQINERWNGTGYPRGRSQKQIHPLARIAAVADVFIALTSVRPHRAAYSPHEAIKIILADTHQGLYEPQSVRGLLQTVSLFPLGSCVELSNATLAITIRNDSAHYDRPTVKIVCDLQGNLLPEQFVNLQEMMSLHIVQSHDKNYLQELLRKRDIEQQEIDDFFDLASSEMQMQSQASL